METRSVELNICQVCNWACPSCNRFCDIFRDSATDTIMSVDDVKGIIAEINSELRVDTFTIIGGEPTLHPDCVEICRLVCEQMANNSRRIAVSTNNSRPDVVAQLRGIPGLAIRVDDSSAAAKRGKHCNMYDVSCITRDRGVDFRKCPEYRLCGIGIFKHHGKIRWFHCPCAQFISRVLDIEDSVAASSLHALLSEDWSAKYSHLLCQYCYMHPSYRAVRPRNFGTVSAEFAPGYAKLMREAAALSQRAGGVADSPPSTAVATLACAAETGVGMRGLFQNSFVISIDDRRLCRFHDVMHAAFGGYGFYAEPRLVRGCTDKTMCVQQRVSASHIQIIEQAKAAGLPYILIFEDDALPRPDAAERMQACIATIPADCDVLTLGSNKRGDVAPVSGSLSEVRGYSWGTHAYIVFASAYDKYISAYRSYPTTPADMYFVKFVKTYIPPEDIFVQHCTERSVSGVVGYAYDGRVRNSAPPAGFLSPDDLVRHPVVPAASDAPVESPGAEVVQPDDGMLSVIFVYQKDKQLAAKVGLVQRPKDLDWHKHALPLFRGLEKNGELRVVDIGIDTMPLTTVDQITERAGVRPPDVVVLDARAHGIPVLYGALRTLALYHPILIFSANPPDIKRDYDTAEHYMRFIDLMAYAHYWLLSKPSPYDHVMQYAEVPNA